MNYGKVDATLAAVVDVNKNAEEPLLAGFIHTAKAPVETATTFLKAIGVRINSPQQQIFTATVSSHAVNQPFDKLMETLAQRSPRHLKRKS